jgi:hypothetical protein
MKKVNRFTLTLFVFGLIALFSAVYGQPTLDIGSRLELFVDDYIIDEMKNTRLVLHHPVDEGPVMKFDQPWEGPFCGYFTVIKDGNTYRLYYRGLPEAGKDGSNLETTCYAESKDGIHWDKPDLGIYEIMNTRNNNVILADDAPFSHNFSPFLDTNPNVIENEKYKARAGTKKTGLFAFTSSDGIHWQRRGDQPVFTQGIFDSQNVAFWSEEEGLYACYFRTWSGEGYSGFRSVSRTTSADFISWTEPQKMDFGDTPMEHLYTNQTHPYFRAPHIYIATAARFMPNRQVLSEEEASALDVNPKYYQDCSDVVLLSSRGGNKYDRTFMESFIRPGIGLQNWVSRSNYPALNIVQTSPTEMSIYVNQDYAQPTAHLRRYSLRIDGISSLHAGYEGGKIITKPLIFSGDDLVINFSTSAAGEIQIVVLDTSGTEMEGFSSQKLIGNEISRLVSWGEHSSLGKLAGKPVRLQIKMKDADLYSLKFE